MQNENKADLQTILLLLVIEQNKTTAVEVGKNTAETQPQKRLGKGRGGGKARKKKMVGMESDQKRFYCKIIVIAKKKKINDEFGF